MATTHTTPVPTASTSLLTASEVARRLCVSKRMVFKLISKGELKVCHIGRATRIRERELERYVEATEVDSAPAAEELSY